MHADMRTDVQTNTARRTIKQAKQIDTTNTRKCARTSLYMHICTYV